MACEGLEGRRLLSTWVTLSGPYPDPGEGDTAMYSVNYFWDQPLAPGGNVTIAYGGSATPGQDYEILTTSVTIPANPSSYMPGAGSIPFSVPIKADNQIEGPETLIVTISSDSEGLILKPYNFPPYLDPTPYIQSTVTIIDRLPTLPFVNVSPYTEAPGIDCSGGSEEFDPVTGAPRPVRFRISRFGYDSSQPLPALSVTYELAGSGSNPADAGDYTNPGGSFTIPAGESSAVLEIPVADDDQVEAALEGLSLTLTGGGIGTGYWLGDAIVATSTIADNDWEISSAAVSFDDQGITYDPQSVYTGTEWYDHDGNGTASTEAGEAKAAPISYWRSIPGQAHKISASPWFALRGNPVSGIYHIKGTGSGPGGGVFEGDVELGRTDAEVHYLTGSFASTQNLPDAIKKGELQISWEIKRVGPQPQTKTYGTSKNTIYVTWVSAPGQSETVLELACTAADGQAVTSDDDQRAIALSVWGKFSGRSTHRVDGTEMKYSHAAGSGTTAAEMLAHADGLGECTAWADLLVQVLTLDGVEAKTQDLWWSETFVVKAVPAQGSGGQPYTGGGTTPLTAFDFHRVVRTRVLNRIFDPSYGGESLAPNGAISPEQRWEDLYLDYKYNITQRIYNTPALDLNWDRVLW